MNYCLIDTTAVKAENVRLEEDGDVIKEKQLEHEKRTDPQSI